MKRKRNALAYVAVSLGMVVAAIAVTSILNKARQGASSDIRAKAGVVATLRARGIVKSVDADQKTFTVNNLRFATSESDTTLGNWTVTPPPGFSLGSLSAGTEVTITIDAATMLAQSSTVTATKIIIEQ